MKSIRRFLAAGVLLLVVLIAIAGCEFFAGLFNPLLGTWKGTLSTTSFTEDVTFTFKSDDTYTCSGTISSVPAGSYSSTFAGSGTFTQDQSAKTITLAGTITITPVSGTGGPTGTITQASTEAYSISGKTLTLTDPTYGAFTLTKQ